MSEHSPAPWRVDSREANPRVFAQDGVVAKVWGDSFAIALANAELIARAPELQSQLAAAQARVAGHIEHIKSLEAEIEQLRATKFRRFANEDCWIYQGDGEDHLETLVCPVVMSAQQVMEFEKAQSRVAELEKYKIIADSFVSLDEKASGKLGQRVAELEREIKDWKNLLREEGDSAIRQVAALTADNQRLRELLRECVTYLPLRGTTYKTMACVESKLEDRIKAAIGEREGE